MEILEQKSIITEMKNSLLGLKSRCEQAENTINEHEDRTIEMIESEEQKEKKVEEK